MAVKSKRLESWMSERKRYALVGTGGRGLMYVEALAGKYRDSTELVGLCDLSPTRMNYYNRRLAERCGAPPVATYLAPDFDRMIAETRPQVVIVTSVDASHHLYINRAMGLGCDVITEKPMTIDAEKARSIFETIAQTGRSLRVTFNYRYNPVGTKVYDLIQQGVVGRPLQVNFMWVLDMRHGADYFRRWHREKDQSGGLLVHKATHHFDLVNWWISSYPQEVFAMGNLLFYGRANAEARGEHYSYSRYTGAPEARHDPFALDLTSEPHLRELYLNAEGDSGYLRDRNVFGERITSEDTMQVTARYRNGVLLSYSLIAYSPWEGFRVAISGTKGRLELDVIEGGTTFVAGKEETIRLEAVNQKVRSNRLRVFPMWGMPYDVDVQQAEGGHGGSDDVLLEDLFSSHPPPDPYHRAASHLDGAASILLGISANRSIETGQLIRVDDLLKL
jgi:predicted dehydrogenase